MLGFVQIIDSHTLGPQIKMVQNTKLFISSSYTCTNFEILNLKTLRAQNNHPTIFTTAKIYAQTVKKLQSGILQLVPFLIRLSSCYEIYTQPFWYILLYIF